MMLANFAPLLELEGLETYAIRPQVLQDLLLKPVGPMARSVAVSLVPYGMLNASLTRLNFRLF